VLRLGNLPDNLTDRIVLTGVNQMAKEKASEAGVESGFMLVDFFNNSIEGVAFGFVFARTFGRPFLFD